MTELAVGSTSVVTRARRHVQGVEAREVPARRRQEDEVAVIGDEAARIGRGRPRRDVGRESGARGRAVGLPDLAAVVGVGRREIGDAADGEGLGKSPGVGSRPGREPRSEAEDALRPRGRRRR